MCFFIGSLELNLNFFCFFWHNQLDFFPIILFLVLVTCKQLIFMFLHLGSLGTNKTEFLWKFEVCF